MNNPDPLLQERRARLGAERMLEVKQAELLAANEKLARHALALSGEVIEKREEVEQVRHQNSRVLDDLEQANHAVDIAERRLWDSLETIEDGFAVYNPNNVMIAANSAYLSVFDDMECVVPGITYEEIVDILLEEGIVDIGAKKSGQWRTDILQRWSSAKPQPYTIKLWNGQFIKLVDRRSRDGDMVSLALNITETIRYEEELKEARAKAVAANRAKSAFLAKMSHELRTPMNGVVGMADLLAETDMNPEQTLFVETIKSSGEALLVLINDVLDFSKIEAEKLVLASEPFDLEKCILDVMVLFQPAVLEKGIELALDYDIFLPTDFVGDPGRVRQILTNLIGNAIKFTEKGHVTIRVVGLPQNADNVFRVHLTVEDTGIGIPEEMHGHVFGEFNQVEDEKNRKFEGTGLGLAITRQLVELMGGEIWVDSEEGAGSNFGFHLDLLAPNGVPELPDAMPEWIRRVVVPNCGLLTTSIVGKQLAALGLQVSETDGCIEPTSITLESGDIVVADTRNCGVDFWQNLNAATASGALIPLILVDTPELEIPPAFAGNATIMKRPMSRSDLVSTIEELRSLPDEISPGSPPHPADGQEHLSPEKTAASSAPDASNNQDEAQDQDPQIMPRRMRILAAEDNKTNRLVFEKLVRHLDIELEFAEDGIQAVEKWKSFSPDLIFMDISMPQMDGKEATQAIRKSEAANGLKRTPIVALTAHAMEGDGEEILSAGLDHYLTKPLRKAAIFGQIADACPDGALPVFPDAPDVAAKG